MDINQVSALKVGCGQFFHGSGMIELLPATLKRFGGRAVVIGGVTGTRIVMDSAKGALDKEGIEYHVFAHEGECTREKAEEFSRFALENNYSVIVGAGGGKCIDLAKATSVLAKLPVVTVPTCIATCVPTSMVCIMYNDKGQREPAIKMEKEVDVCIADTDLIATSPARLHASGILDSIAKLPECYHLKKVENYRDCDTREYIQLANAKALAEFLYGEGRDVYRNGKNAKRFEDCILTNFLHTSIVSGFADGSGQLALAHATYDFMRTHNTEASAPYLHGEIVAVGLLMQQAFNGDSPEEVDKTRQLMKDMDMPLTLKEIGFDASSEERMKFYLETIASDGHLTTAEERDRLKEAVKVIL